MKIQAAFILTVMADIPQLYQQVNFYKPSCQTGVSKAISNYQATCSATNGVDSFECNQITGIESSCQTVALNLTKFSPGSNVIVTALWVTPQNMACQGHVQSVIANQAYQCELVDSAGYKKQICSGNSFTTYTCQDSKCQNCVAQVTNYQGCNHNVWYACLQPGDDYKLPKDAPVDFSNSYMPGSIHYPTYSSSFDWYLFQVIGYSILTLIVLVCICCCVICFKKSANSVTIVAKSVVMPQNSQQQVQSLQQSIPMQQPQESPYYYWGGIIKMHKTVPIQKPTIQAFEMSPTPSASTQIRQAAWPPAQTEHDQIRQGKSSVSRKPSWPPANL